MTRTQLLSTDLSTVSTVNIFSQNLWSERPFQQGSEIDHIISDKETASFFGNSIIETNVGKSSLFQETTFKLSLTTKARFPIGRISRGSNWSKGQPMKTV